MKKVNAYPIIIFICALCLSGIGANHACADINGSVQTNLRLRFDPQELTRNENRFTLKFEGNPADNTHYFSEITLKGLRLFEEEEAYRWELDLKEAYLDLYEFLSDRLDVRIGKQIIAWGKADQLNPSSNVCPDDLADTFDFGQKLGVNAINATFYLNGNTSLSGIIIPEFTPATLPAGDMANVFGGAMPLPEGIVPRTITQHTHRPESTWEETAQYAVKLSGMLLGFDVSASYVYGRDDLPVPNQVILTPVGASGKMDIDVDLIYPRQQVVGVDMAGSIKSVGVWGEAALFFPGKVTLKTGMRTQSGLQPKSESVSQSDDPYLKFVVGGDYTFESGWYVNAQFLHGFVHERSTDELNDYLIARVEKSFLRDTLKIVPFGVALAIPEWDNLSKNYAFVGNPELTYYPADSVELVLGAMVILGQGDNLFSQIKDQDELYFRAKVSF